MSGLSEWRLILALTTEPGGKKYALNREELRYYDTRKHKRGYEVNAELNGWQYYIAHPYDALGAYRFLLEAIKDNEYLLEKNPRGGVTWVI